MLEELSLLFKALSDETRLRILMSLLKREYCVSELSEIIGTTQPNISFHLGILLQAGLIKGRQCGKNIHYIAAPDDIFKRFILYGIYEKISGNSQTESNFPLNEKSFCKRRRLLTKEEDMYGRNGNRCGYSRGAGGSGFNCVCNKCGTKVPHTPGVPCRQEKCPKCGSPMVREGSPHDRNYNMNKGENTDE